MKNIITIIIISIYLLLLACNEPDNRLSYDYKYEITFTFGVVGYSYDCDSYLKIGNTYKLYRGKKLYMNFEAGNNILVSIKLNN